MRATTCLMLGVSALAIAGCTNLPGASLGATIGAERYLNGTHGGDDFNGYRVGVSSLPAFWSACHAHTLECRSRGQRRFLARGSAVLRE